MKTVIGLFDLHYPAHEPDVLSIALQLAKDYPPDVFILGGDNLNCGSVSSHNPPARVRVEQPIDLDIVGFDEKILLPIEALKPKDKYLFIGNHEMWLQDYMDAHPELGKTLDFVKGLKLKERGWQIVPYKKYARIGKVYFHHGDWRASRKGASYGAKHHAWKAVERTGRSVRYGHQHTWQVHSHTSPIDNSDAHTAMCVPCACKLDQDYLEGGDTNWLNGLYLGWVRDSGDFNDFAVIVSKGKSTFAGKTYEA